MYVCPCIILLHPPCDCVGPQNHVHSCTLFSLTGPLIGHKGLLNSCTVSVICRKTAFLFFSPYYSVRNVLRSGVVFLKTAQRSLFWSCFKSVGSDNGHAHDCDQSVNEIWSLLCCLEDKFILKKQNNYLSPSH